MESRMVKGLALASIAALLIASRVAAQSAFTT
jgi:hypothetical protein